MMVHFPERLLYRNNAGFVSEKETIQEVLKQSENLHEGLLFSR